MCPTRWIHVHKSTETGSDRPRFEQHIGLREYVEWCSRNLARLPRQTICSDVGMKLKQGAIRVQGLDFLEIIGTAQGPQEGDDPI
jgi:hypothetical protein